MKPLCRRAQGNQELLRYGINVNHVSEKPASMTTYVKTVLEKSIC